MVSDAAVMPPQIRALRDRLGEEVTSWLKISDRRGSCAWRVETAQRTVALKTLSSVPDPERNKALEIAAEIRTMSRLVQDGAIDPSYPVASGYAGCSPWSAVAWLSGRPVWEAFADAREKDTPQVRDHVRKITTTWASGLARMHAHGWAQGDVQPTNTIIGAERAHLIDYALSHPVGEAHTGLPYRGAITHTMAPEIAAALRSTDERVHVPPTPQADVWALGASLFWCWTGQRPGAYPQDMPREGKLSVLAGARLRPLHRVRPWPWPEFEELLISCLDVDPPRRPTAGEIAAW
ncbi:hypothetical protein AB0L75_08580 [Streptomyces sp. NPDC052101]|uniref:protein kinase domain-containing protein n=1 Tax=Streptomyces sp. NPDC052101 TaxID=3155763 RepID=UPI0034164C53